MSLQLKMLKSLKNNAKLNSYRISESGRHETSS